MTQWPRLSYPRVTANRSDLTLQGGPNSHDTCKPRRATRVSCFHHYHDIWTTPAKTQVKGPSRWTPGEPGGDIQSNTRHHPTPSVAGRDSKHRCNSVHSLPISTTPTSDMWLVLFKLGQHCQQRYGPQSTQAEATFHTFHIHNPISLRPVSIFLSHRFILKPLCHK